jgi:hypothetical protein
MYCPNCKQEYDGKFCPECGTKLIESPAAGNGVNINLGDANAISGGVNVTNTTNIQNTYIQEREKSESELEQEKRIKFMSLCEKVLEDGILENHEIVQLEDERIRLGLDKGTANMMIEQARQSSLNVKTELAARDAITMKIINMQIQKNDVNQIKAQFPKLEAIHEMYKNDSVNCTYYMLLSTLFPERLIILYEENKADDYWQTYWVYIAYLKEAVIDKAEKALAKLNWFTRYPESNDLLLSALNSKMEFGPDIAKDYLSILESEPCSPELNPLYHALLFEIDSEKAVSFGINDNNIAYYLNAIVRMEDPREKAAIIEKENADKREWLEKNFLKIVKEYGTSNQANRLFKQQEKKVRSNLFDERNAMKVKYGLNSPEYKESDKAYYDVDREIDLGCPNLLELRKRVNNPYAIKIIDEELKYFVENELLPGKEEERKRFQEEAVQKEIAEEQERQEEEKQRLKLEKENQEYETICQKRLASKADRDKRAPLLGEAYIKICEGIRKRDQKQSESLGFDVSARKIEAHVDAIFSKISRIDREYRISNVSRKHLRRKDYNDAFHALHEATQMGCKDLWSVRQNVDNLLVQEEVDNAMEVIVKQECDNNSEFKQWFEEREKEIG